MALVGDTWTVESVCFSAAFTDMVNFLLALSLIVLPRSLPLKLVLKTTVSHVPICGLLGSTKRNVATVLFDRLKYLIDA